MSTKMEKLEELITRQERELTRSIWLNRVLYALIIIIFAIYAIVVPKTVGKVLDPEVGSELILSKVEESVPTAKDLIEKGKAQIPELVTNTLDKAESYTPQLETVMDRESQKVIKKTTAHIQEDLKPMLKDFVKEHMPKLKENATELKTAQGINALNDELSKAIDVIVDKKLKEFKKDLAKLTRELNKLVEQKPRIERDRARKNLLLAFARLHSDESYKDKAIDKIMDALSCKK